MAQRGETAFRDVPKAVIDRLGETLQWCWWEWGKEAWIDTGKGRVALVTSGEW